MKKVLSFLFLIIVVSVLSIWWFGNSKQPITPPVSAPNKETNAVSSPAKNIAISSVAKSETNSSDKIDTNSIAIKYKEYLAGKMDKAELAKAMISERNAQSQDFYGEVIDQYGNPVIGATVNGNIMIDSLETSKEETYTTETDQMGFFQFTGLHGISLGVAPSKAGYEWESRGVACQMPSGGKSSSDNRAILTMWKLRGAEPMKHIKFESEIPYDGTSATFNLQTGKKTEGGDLRITLLRSPLEIKPGLIHPYGWEVKIELINGGIMEENDPYPYWAPENGYQSFFEAGMNSNDRPWRPEFIQNFYFKNSQGQYGRLLINLLTSSKRPQTGFTIETWLNPSGSQNLEFNPAKQAQ